MKNGNIFMAVQVKLDRVFEIVEKQVGAETKEKMEEEVYQLLIDLVLGCTTPDEFFDDSTVH